MEKIEIMILIFDKIRSSSMNEENPNDQVRAGNKNILFIKEKV